MMMNAFVLLVLHTSNIATVSYSVNLSYSVRGTNSSVCMSRAVPTMIIAEIPNSMLTRRRMCSHVRW